MKLSDIRNMSRELAESTAAEKRASNPESAGATGAQRMKLSDVKSMSQEIAEKITTDKLGPRPEPVAETETEPKHRHKPKHSDKMPYGAIWLSVLLTTLCCISLLFSIATVSVLNIPGAIIFVVASALFGWMAFKSIGWTETL